jgi:hypothetical protein
VAVERAIGKLAMVKVAAAQVGVTSSRASAQTSKRRSRHIRISIEFRSNVTNHRRRRRQDVIIRSENPVPCKPDANSGDRTVTEERCSTSSPNLEDDDDDDDDALMSASCCSSNGSCDDERIKFTDLEVRITSILPSSILELIFGFFCI